MHHPGMLAFWHARRRAACGQEVGCGADAGPGAWHGAHEGHRHGHGGGHGGGDGEDFGASSLGVRRPLRFLAFKLDLEDAQVTELAAILSELKTERAQAVVDQRRTTSALADAVAAESFDDAKVRSAADERVKSTERVQGAVVAALRRIHGLLKPEQRTKLAYLLRTGALSI